MPAGAFASLWSARLLQFSGLALVHVFGYSPGALRSRFYHYADVVLLHTGRPVLLPRRTGRFCVRYVTCYDGRIRGRGVRMSGVVIVNRKGVQMRANNGRYAEKVTPSSVVTNIGPGRTPPERIVQVDNNNIDQRPKGQAVVTNATPATKYRVFK